MRIIGIGENNKLIVEVTQGNLKAITDTTEDFVVGQEVEVGTDLTILHQIKRKKTKYVTGLTELANTIDQL